MSNSIGTFPSSNSCGIFASKAFIRCSQASSRLPQRASDSDIVAPGCQPCECGQAQTLVLKALTKHGVCRLKSAAKSSQYNREWSFRVLALERARTVGIQTLYYSKKDDVFDLPRPDLKDVRSQLARLVGKKRRVADLYEHYGVRVAPEYICVAACLGKGRFKQNAVLPNRSCPKRDRVRSLEGLLGSPREAQGW